MIIKKNKFAQLSQNLNVNPRMKIKQVIFYIDESNLKYARIETSDPRSMVPIKWLHECVKNTVSMSWIYILILWINYLFFAWCLLITVVLVNYYGVGHIVHLNVLKLDIACTSWPSLHMQMYMLKPKGIYIQYWYKLNYSIYM